ncbi:glycosyltransferase family 2 protein, partial [Chloroflexus sp.]|uniref:glycosyltransferase n=1 Tax=Chloroflexus sp. TaxID=1904827 RepID=UPI00298EF97E
AKRLLPKAAALRKRTKLLYYQRLPAFTEVFMWFALVWALCGLALVASFGANWRRMRRIPRLLPPCVPPDPPFISILIPARNEERAIRRCVSGALAQRYPHFEVIVVDDGSTDRTPAILAELAATDSRLRVVPGRPLPPGWVGKCNACQQASDAASGEWLLFLDADTAPAPDLAAALLCHALATNGDMVTIFPFLELGTWAERLVLPPFIALIVSIFPFERLAQPDVRPDEVLANGQCIFVRRAAYDAIGGHNAVRGEVLEDVRLGQTLRAAGFTVRGAIGMEYLAVRMYTSAAEVAEGLMKNASAGSRSGGWRSLTGMSLLLAQAYGPLALMAGGLLIDGLAGCVAFGAGLLAWLVGLLFWGTLYRRFYRLNPLYALLWPVGLMMYLFIAGYGIVRVQLGRGVTWKGRRYAG